MHVQTVEVRALQAVLRDEHPFFAPQEQVKYVIARCPCQTNGGYIYGLAKWDLAPATGDFRRRHIAGRIKK